MRWILVVAMLGLVACDDGDGDGGGGGGTLNSGVDESKQVGQLTDEEANQICRASSEYGASIVSKSQACTFAGLLFAQDQASCEQLAEMCLEAPEEPDDTEDSCNEGLPPELEGCTATVGEIEDCQAALANEYRAAVSGLSCADAGNTENLGEVLNTDPVTLPACQAIQAKCPNAFQDDSNDAM